MSVMANTTPIVTTITKPATREKTLKDADATPRVNIQNFCEEHYEDILPVIMDKIRVTRRKEVHADWTSGEKDGDQTWISLPRQRPLSLCEKREGTPLSRGSKSGTSGGGHWKSKYKIAQARMKMLGSALGQRLRGTGRGGSTVERWEIATWLLNMFNSTLHRGATRVLVTELPTAEQT
ncbi:hypothetical protein Tco_1352979 [Tanacetum coccineum]